MVKIQLITFITLVLSQFLKGQETSIINYL